VGAGHEPTTNPDSRRFVFYSPLGWIGGFVLTVVDRPEPLSGQSDPLAYIRVHRRISNPASFRGLVMGPISPEGVLAAALAGIYGSVRTFASQDHPNLVVVVSSKP
jgi:hypothetical protein